MKKNLICLLAVVVLVTIGGYAQDMVLKGGTVLTITDGLLADGMVVIQDGKITAVGRGIALPGGIEVIDTTGRYVMPGIIDSHSHIALEDVNESSDPVTPQVWMKDAFDPDSDAILKTLAGGVTTIKAMHGSANVIGGVNVTLKLKYSTSVKEMIIPGARHQLKIALGENPKRSYGSRGRRPSTRMGIASILKEEFTKAGEYKERWDRYAAGIEAGKTNAVPPEEDLGLETLKMVLEKKLSVDCHAYRAEEIVWIIEFCKDRGIDLKQISHCVDGYKVADIMADAGVSYGGWTDWWGFKDELYDACPYGIKIMFDAGTNVVLNSDNPDECRYLNLIAAKVLKYNDIAEGEVLKMITINPARALEIDERVGSLELGKDGDVAVFDKHPLDSTSKCLMTIIEGVVYFDYHIHGSETKGGRR